MAKLNDMEFFSTDIINKLAALDEDLDIQLHNPTDLLDTVFDDGNYAIYHTDDIDTLNYFREEFGWGDGTPAQWYSYRPDMVYFLCDLRDIGRRWFMVKGSGTILTPRNSWTSGSNVIEKTKDEELIRYFIKNKWPYITNSLQKKGYGRLAFSNSNNVYDKTELIYPDDFKDENGKVIDIAAMNSKSKDVFKATKLIISEGVSRLKQYLFRYMTTLREVILPASLKAIGDMVFYGCTSLESVVFPSQSRLTSIGSYAFGLCYSLHSITLPASLETLGYNCFGISSWNKKAPGGSGLRSIIIPDKIKKIPGGCFAGQDLSGGVTLPSGLEEIAAEAFHGSKLNHIDIPDTVREMGYGCFVGSDITELHLPSSVQKVNGRLLGGSDRGLAGFYNSHLSRPEVEAALSSLKTRAEGNKYRIVCDVSEKPSGWSDEFNCLSNEVKWNEHAWNSGICRLLNSPMEYWNELRDIFPGASDDEIETMIKGIRDGLYAEVIYNGHNR